MSYTIEYGKPSAAVWRPRLGVLTCLCLALFLLLTWGFWPQGREALGRMLLPGEDALAAAEVFAQALQCGMPLTDAAELFCIQVVSGAGLGG